MVEENLIEALEAEADYKRLKFHKLSEYHYRMTDGDIMFDLWPTTGTFRAFRGRDVLLNGSVNTHEQLTMATETVWPTILIKK